MRTEAQRTPKERIVDRALLLALYVRTAETKAIGDKLKAQKLAFLSAYPLFTDRCKAFNLEFYRHDYGPMSTALYQTWTEFNEIGLIPIVGNSFGKPSKKAVELVDDFWTEVLSNPDNKLIANRIAQVAKEFGPYTTGRILDYMYEFRAATLENKSPRPIRDIEMYQHFTGVLDRSEAKAELVVDPAWLDTLAIVLIPANERALNQSAADLRAGRIAAR